MFQVSIDKLFYLCFFSFFCIKVFAADTVRIGIILSSKGQQNGTISPSKTAINIALQDSPLNFRDYFFPSGNCWRCENNILKSFKDHRLAWQLPIKIYYSLENSVYDQMNQLVNKDSVLVILGVPNSALVKDIFELKDLNTPVISSIATASEYTIEARSFSEDPQKKEEWTNHHKWFFRATSPDIVRVESLIDWLIEDGIKNSYVLYSNDAYGNGLKEDFKSVVSTKNNLSANYSPFSASEQSPDEDSLSYIKSEIRNRRAKIESIIVFGNSKDATKVIEKIKPISDNIPTFVIEARIDKKENLFWGKTFNNVRTLSAPLVWNADFDVKQFAKKYFDVIHQNFGDEDLVPLASGFAYDATIISLTAIERSISQVGLDKWRQLSYKSRKEVIRYTLELPLNLPLVMSRGSLTESHDVVTKLQRSYIQDNKLYLYTSVPNKFSWFWFILIFGGGIGGLTRVILFAHNKLKINRYTGSYFPPFKFILTSMIVGIFGAILMDIFWDTTLMHEILPKFFDQFNLQDNALVIGILGGIIPTAIITFLNKGESHTDGTY